MLTKIIQYFKKAKGFSLLEMSVVLASVAAVIVVTAGGVTMINKARLGDIISDIVKFTQATAKFQEKYGALPGDIANVSQLSGATAGNGNGAIDTANESLYFWQDLALSGLLEGTYNGSSTNVPGTGVPKGSMDASGYNVIIPSTITTATVPDQAIVFEFSGFSASSNSLPILTPEDAKSIDVKADDGNPTTGTILAVDPGANECITAGNVYNVSNKSASCRLLFVVMAGKTSGDAAAVTGTCTQLGMAREIDDTAATCPTGFEGKIMQTCRISSANVGAWETTARNCEPVKCGTDAAYGDTRSLACINGLTGSGTTQTCSEIGIWVTTADNCTPDTTTLCTPDGTTRAAQACSYGEAGEINQTCTSGAWGTPTSNTCTDILCSASAIGTSRTYSGGCGTGFTGTAKEVCTINQTWEKTSISSSCAPVYGACTGGVDANKNIGCPTGETGTHWMTCVENGASDYWTTLTDSCQPITCDGHENVGTERIKDGAECPNDNNGAVMQYCDGTGTWTDVYTNCTGSCNAEASHNALWPTTAAGDTANASSCLTGYAWTTQPTRTCSIGGVWSSTVTNDTCAVATCAAGTYEGATYPLSKAGETDVSGTCVWPAYEGIPTADCSTAAAWSNTKNACQNSGLPVTSNLAAWYDAADTATVLNTSSCTAGDYSKAGTNTVGCWLDKSGNANNAVQATPANEPTYTASAMNGKPVLSFNGTSAVNLVAPDSNSLDITGDMTGMAVVKFNSLGTYNSIFSKTSGGAPKPYDWYTPIANPTNSRLYVGDGSSSQNFDTSPFIKPSANYVLTFTITTVNKTIQQFQNGVPNGSKIYTNSRAGGTDSFYIGGRIDGGTYMNGQIAEILMYNAALSDSDRGSVESYLGEKWGISVIPAMAEKYSPVIWLDADDASTLFQESTCTTLASTTQTIGCWKDKSPNSLNVIQDVSTAYEPTYSASAIGNKNALLFGTNLYLRRADGANSPLDYTGSNTFFTVAKIQTLANSLIFSKRNAGTVHSQFSLTSNATGASTGMQYCYNTSICTYSENGGSIMQNQENIYTWVNDLTNGRIKYFQNGVSMGFDTGAISTPATDDHLYITSYIGSSYWFTGWIGEMIMLPYALSDADHLKVEQYLGDKWDISVLPTTTPVGVWYDADDQATLSDTYARNDYATSGQYIQAWYDKGTHAVHQTQTGATTYRPIYYSTQLNSRSTAYFDGGDNLGALTVYGSNFGTAQEITAFWVYKYVNPVHNSEILTVAPSAGYQFNLHPLWTDSKVYWDYGWYGNSTGRISFAPSDTTLYTDKYIILTTDIKSNDTGTVWLNGSQVATQSGMTSTYPVATSSTLYMGNVSAGAAYGLKGNIAEIATFKTAMPDADRDAVGTYLSDKWGLDWTADSALDDAVFWVDASDTSTIFTDTGCTTAASTGNLVSCWADKTANGYDLVPLATREPTYMANGTNNLNVMDFSGTKSMYPPSFALNTLLHSFTVSVVASPDATHQIDPESLLGSLGNGSQFYLIFPTSGWGSGIPGTPAGTGISLGTNGMSVYQHTINSLPPPTVYSGSMSGYHIITMRQESSVAKLYRDGTMVRSGLTTAKSPIFIRPGLGGDPSCTYNCWNGKVGEMLVFATALNDTTRGAIEEYLGDKWGITVSSSGTEFYPTIRNYALWYDAQDISTLKTDTTCATAVTASGNSVGCWMDKSGNGRNAIKNNAFPTYQSSSINSKPSVRFTSASSQDMTMDISFLNSSAYTMFIIGQRRSTAQSFFIANNSVGVTNEALHVGYLLDSGGTTTFRNGHWGNDLDISNVPGYSSPTPLLMFARLSLTNGRDTYVIQNGVKYQNYDTSKTGPLVNITSTEGRLGNQFQDTGYLDGDIGEVIIYPIAITDTDKMAMETYLGDKWGIASTTNTVAGNSTLWYDATDASTLFTNTGCTTAASTGQAIGCWKDKSTNANNATQATNPPVYTASGINGKNTLVFDGVNDMLYTVNTVNLSATQKFSLFVVQQNDWPSLADGTAATMVGWSSPNYSAYSDGFSLEYVTFATIGSAGLTGLIKGNGGGYNIRSNNAYITEPAIIKVEFNTANAVATEVVLYKNGIELSDQDGNPAGYNNDNSNFFGNRNVSIGATGGYGSPFKGDIGEVILYPSILNKTTTKSVETYLADKWNIVIVPAQ